MCVGLASSAVRIKDNAGEALGFQKHLKMLSLSQPSVAALEFAPSEAGCSAAVGVGSNDLFN